jgi:hypothetical protein
LIRIRTDDRYHQALFEVLWMGNCSCVLAAEVVRLTRERQAHLRRMHSLYRQRRRR